MLIEHLGKSPRIHETAWVAPTAVLCGDVTVGENSRVLFGAILTAEGGSEFTPTPITNPVSFFPGLVTVLFRPFPFEAGSILQLVTSFEGIAVLGLALVAALAPGQTVIGYDSTTGFFEEVLTVTPAYPAGAPWQAFPSIGVAPPTGVPLGAIS